MEYQMVDSVSLSFVTFQFAAAAMAGGAAVSIGALFLSSLNQKTALCYSAGLSMSICVVAYINYSSMIKTRLNTIKACGNAKGNKNDCIRYKHEDDFVVTCLRYTDWLVTMPLLAIKLLDLARGGPNAITSEFLTWVNLEAFVGILAFAMILMGFIALLSVGDFQDCRYDNGPIMLLRWGLYLGGLVCLIIIYVIIFMTCNETESIHVTEVYGFALLWTLYPIAFVAQIWGLCGPPKDIVYSILDVLSKPLLSVYILKSSL